MFSKVESAIDLGLEYVLEEKGTNLLWEDFNLTCGVGDIWPTSMILANVGLVSTPRVIKPTLDFLCYLINANANIGYNRFAPTDCDTLAWMRLALIRNNSKTFGKVDVIELLDKRISEFRIQDSVYFSTFSSEEYLSDTVTGSDLSSWTGPHLCTTVSVAASGYESSIQRSLTNRPSTEVRLPPSLFWYDSGEIQFLQLFMSDNLCLQPYAFLVGKQIEFVNGIWGLLLELADASFNRRIEQSSGVASLLQQIIHMQNEDGSWDAQFEFVYRPPPLHSSLPAVVCGRNQTGQNKCVSTNPALTTSFVIAMLKKCSAISPL